MCEIQFVQLITPRRGKAVHNGMEEEAGLYGFRDLGDSIFCFVLVSQRGKGANGGPLGARPPSSLQTGVRMSINHLLIITALPAHNEKVKLSDIAPEVVYETTLRASQAPGPRRSELRRTAL